jgi:hypothetical protein
MNHYDSLQLLAVRAVMKPDGEYRLRKIFRWYSTTFHTPLHLVDDLPLEDVLTAYYEQTCEEMNDEDREILLKELLETEEEKRAKQKAKDAEEAEAFEFARRLAAEAKLEAAKAKLADVKPVVKAPSMLSAKDRREVKLPDSKPAFEKLEPDVEIKFVEAGEFEKELEGFGIMTPKEAK